MTVHGTTLSVAKYDRITVFVVSGEATFLIKGEEGQGFGRSGG